MLAIITAPPADADVRCAVFANVLAVARLRCTHPGEPNAGG